MKRLFVLLAALAAVSSVVVGSAFAGGGNTVASCNAGNNYTVQGASNNVDVPAGTFCYLLGEFQGNVSVEGYAVPLGTKFDRNVNVTGGTIAIGGSGADIKGNLNISGSHGFAGVPYNTLRADYASITIEGNLNYTGNFVPLYVGTTGSFNVHVIGNFTYSGNTVPSQA
jgi:hypothetical protein